MIDKDVVRWCRVVGCVVSVLRQALQLVKLILSFLIDI